MKRTITFTLILAVGLAMAALAGGNGAVTVPFDTNVGTVTINTTGSGRVIATGHLDNGRPNAEYSISLRIRYENGSNDPYPDIATFTTNGQGKGNFNVQVDTAPRPGDTTLRRVAVRVRNAPNDADIAVAWDVPLK